MYQCVFSSLTLFELWSGAKTERHFEDIQKIRRWIEAVSFDDGIAEMTAAIFRTLKQQNELIDYRDIFIAATAKYHNLCLATLNTEHFERVAGLTLLDLKTL